MTMNLVLNENEIFYHFFKYSLSSNIYFVIVIKH